MKIIDVPPTILQYLDMAHQEISTEWGAPETLGHTLPPVPPLDASMLPPELWPWVSDIARRVQCPIDYVAASAIVMLGSVIGTGCAIRPKQKDNWAEIPNLWGAVVGPPGSKKSPALSAAMKPLFGLDHAAQQDYVNARLQYDIALDQHKTALENYKKQRKGSQGQPAAHPGPPPSEPVCKRYYTNDCTFEALGGMLAGNPRGCLVNHDELTSLLAGFDRAGREGERQGYLTAWNGQQSHRVDRVGRGVIYIPRFAVSILGGIQPDKLEEFLANTQHHFGNDGFMQRMQVMVYPDPLEITSIVDDTPDFKAQQEIETIADTLAHRIDTLKPQPEQPGEIPFFRFALRVQPHFNQWLLSTERRVVAEESPLVAEHLAKYRKLVPALALIDHLVGMSSGRITKGENVQQDSLNRALAFAEYLEAHARRVYAITTNRQGRAVLSLGKKLQSGALQDGFSTRDVERKGWSGLTDATDIKGACKELEYANWIRSNPSPKRTSGRPPLQTYSINPAILKPVSAGAAPTKPTKHPRRKSP